MAGSHKDIPGTGTAHLPAAPAVPKGTDFPPAPRSGPIRDLKGRFAGGTAVAWNGLPAVASLPARVQGDLQGATDRALAKLQDEMVTYAQANAPWEDFTGDARAELHSPSITTASNGDKSVILAHGVSYGIHLETLDGGRLGIIARTIDHFAEEVPARIAAELKL